MDVQFSHTTTEQLSALLDGRLSDDERATVEAHLAQCPMCRGDLEQLRRTVAFLHTVPDVAPPRSFRVTMTEPRPRLAPLPRAVRPELLRMLAGVAAALMVVVFVADAAQPVAMPGPSTRLPAPAAAPAASDQAERSAQPAAAGAVQSESVDLRPAGATATPIGPAALRAAEEPASRPEPAPPPAPEVLERRGVTLPPAADASVTAAQVPEEARRVWPTLGQLAALALGVIAMLFLAASLLLPRRS